MKTSGILVILALALVLVFTGCGNAATSTTSSTTTSTTTSPKTTSTTTSTKTTTSSIFTTKMSTSALALLAVTTGGVSGITVSGAALSGSFSGTPAQERGFEWGTVPGKYEYSWAESGTFQPGSFNRTISGLEEGATYYFRCKACSAAGWAYGAEKSFKVLALAKISAVTPNNAKQGDNLIVTITGSGFTGATAISFGDNVTVNGFTVVSETQISANITLSNQAVGGARGISVTTPAGSASLPGAFTIERVLRTVTWTDAQMNWLSILLTGQTQYAYTIHFQPGSKLYVTSVMSFIFGVEIRNGRLCFIGVTAEAWDNIYYKAYPNIKYDSANRVASIEALPAEGLQTLFDPPVNTLPLIESVTTGNGTVTFTYYYP
jgi:hypothetical protein